MRRRLPLTLLLLLLVLLPGAILAWLGWQAQAPLENRARGMARLAQRDLGSRLTARAEELHAELTAPFRVRASELAEGLATALARGNLLLRLSALRRALPEGYELRVETAEGAVILPRPAESAAPEEHWAQEWPEFAARRAEVESLRLRAGQPRLAAERALRLADELATLRYRAQALALALSCLPEEDERAAVEAQLCRLPVDAVAQGGPAVVEAMLASAAGRRRLTDDAARAALLECPATEAQRGRWQAALDGGATGAGGHSLGGHSPEGHSLTVRAPLPGDLRASLRVRAAATEAALTERLLQTRAGDPDLSVARQPGPRALAVDVQLLGRRHTLYVHHAALAALDDAGSRRRVVGGLGILGLLALMVTGVVLLRRSMLREQAARQLRDDFIANISHELKTPLTSVRMHADMLADPGIPASDREEYGAVVRSEGARLSQLIDDLLEFSAAHRELDCCPVDVAAAVRAAASAWRPIAAAQGTAIEVEADAAPQALAEPGALSRVLANLLQNACRHGLRGPAAAGARIRLLVGQRGGEVEVRVVDPGPGVPAAERAAIFDRFYQGEAARRRGGTGIGLPLSRELCRRMGGDLLLMESTPSTFAVRLPLAAENP